MRADDEEQPTFQLAVALLEKSIPEIEIKLLVFFTFFINFFYENINQEHNLLPDCASGTFTYVCCENCMPGFFAFVLKACVRYFLKT